MDARLAFCHAEVVPLSICLLEGLINWPLSLLLFKEASASLIFVEDVDMSLLRVSRLSTLSSTVAGDLSGTV